MNMFVSEIVNAFGRFFLHPVFYIFFISSLLVGYWRVKQERKDFSFKVYDVWYELRTSAMSGFGFGLILSVISIGIGIILSKASLLIIACWTILFALLTQYRYLSAAYSFGITIFYFVFSPEWKTGQPMLDTWLADSSATNLTALAVLMALLLIVEGLLISGRASRISTPKILKGKRGMSIGMHVCKRLWFVPIFILVPGDAITKIFAWWPVITIDTNVFSLFLVPFSVGFSKSIKGQLPSQAIFYTGRRVAGLGLLVLLIAIISYWLPGIAIAAAGAAMLGRLSITIREQIEDEKHPAFFSPKSTAGLMILDTLPNSPAEEMGLKPGEIISKVNGVMPKSLREFYQALQHNTSGAFCKLEVIDINSEPRILQRAIFANEHHELGIIFVQRDYDWDIEAV